MRRHRVLMIGAGGMAATWLSWFLPEVADRCVVVGLVDVDAAVVRRATRRSGSL